MQINRRRALQVLGTLGGLGLAGRYALLPPSRSRKLDAPRELAIRFYESLSAEDRKRICVDYDDPIRQFHNKGVRGGGLWVNPMSLGWEQRSIVNDLLHAGLSEAGQQRVPNEFFTRWPGVHSMNVLLCGNPKTQPYQLILTGPHLNLRVGGRSREGAAFGGPLSTAISEAIPFREFRATSLAFSFKPRIACFRACGPRSVRLRCRKTRPFKPTSSCREARARSPASSSLARRRRVGQSRARSSTESCPRIRPRTSGLRSSASSATAARKGCT